MFRVLVVDDDDTCLKILKACLEKWNYEVTTVKHVQEALSMLKIKPFDLVLSDIHMPDTNGFELLRQVDQDFNLPVILISGDTSPDVMWMGVKNGAQHFLIKPIEANDVKHIWQYSFWWKKIKANNIAPNAQINDINDEVTLTSAIIGTVGDDTIGRKNKKVVWTSDLHSRFVEAILVIGYQKAVPANIFDVMNVPGLTRGQVASHLQKYQKFLQRVLEGRTNIEFSNWIDLNYYSSFVSGNPDLLLINQLREEQRNGNLATHNPLRPPKEPHISTNVRAPNGSSTSNQYKPLPLYDINEASSKRSENATWIPDNYTFSSFNAALSGMNNVNLPNAYSEKMRGIVENSTFNSVHNMSSSRIGYYNQNALDEEQNTYSQNGGLVGGDINNMISSANNVAPFSTAPLYNNFYSQESFNVGTQGNNNFDFGNNSNTDQLGNYHKDPCVGVLFNVNHFENASTTNAQQFGGEQMSYWLNNSGLNSKDSDII